MGGDNGDKAMTINNFEMLRAGDEAWTTISLAYTLSVWHPFAVTINNIVYIHGEQIINMQL